MSLAMVKLMIYLPEEQYETLRRLAYEQHRSMADIVREALRAHLEAQAKQAQDRKDG